MKIMLKTGISKFGSRKKCSFEFLCIEVYIWFSYDEVLSILLSKNIGHKFVFLIVVLFNCYTTHSLAQVVRLGMRFL